MMEGGHRDIFSMQIRVLLIRQRKKKTPESVCQPNRKGYTIVFGPFFLRIVQKSLFLFAMLLRMVFCGFL
jgi:hypothetical protein